MRSLRSALSFIGVAGVAFGVAIAFIAFNADRESGDFAPGVTVALVLLPSWSFLGTGLYAWWRRPHNRCGMLMVATGFAWLLLPLALSDTPALFQIGQAFGTVVWFVLVWLLLCFPTGELGSLRERWLLRVAFISAVVLPATASLFLDPQNPANDCSNCPVNPILIADAPDLTSAIGGTAALIGAFTLVGLIVILVRRYRALETAGRYAIEPVLFAGGATGFFLILMLLSDVFRLGDSVSGTLFLFVVVALSTVPFAFLIGGLRNRLTSAGAVSELIAALGDSGGQGADIRDALAEALGDDDLQLAFWLPERGVYVSEEGREVELPAGPGRRSTLVEHDGELIAAIDYDASLDVDPQLLRAAGAGAALALRNQRLAAELRANVVELRESRARIVNASDSARRRIERDLHDGAQQHLVSLALSLRLAQ